MTTTSETMASLTATGNQSDDGVSNTPLPSCSKDIVYTINTTAETAVSLSKPRQETVASHLSECPNNSLLLATQNTHNFASKIEQTNIDGQTALLPSIEPSTVNSSMPMEFCKELDSEFVPQNCTVIVMNSDNQFKRENPVLNNLASLTNVSTIPNSCRNLTKSETIPEAVNGVEQPGPSNSYPDLESSESIYAPDTGDKWYNVPDSMVSPLLNPRNLPKAFEYLPINGKPDSKADLEEFQLNKIRDFVGCDLNDEEFKQLEDYCNPDHLKTGKELVMLTGVPSYGLLPNDIDNQHQYKSANQRQNSSLDSSDEEFENSQGQELCIVKKHKMRIEKDERKYYTRRLKYRGVRLMPLAHQEENEEVTAEKSLEPGKDMLFRVRIYRPFPYSAKERPQSRSRHSVFCRDVVLLGRQPLTELRERIVCPNDVDTRIDVSDRPHDLPATTAKELFPSGFLFINNVFYVDHRQGCSDTSARIRSWAAGRGLGRFPARSLAAALHSVRLRLGHPEVYVHQGNCEHLFTFSEIRLLTVSDPLSISNYPTHTAVAQNQSVYCTTCAEFSAKWIVAGCPRVPFDPAFFCDTCLKMYLYKDGEKIGDFKLYSYRGNEINILKPHG